MAHSVVVTRKPLEFESFGRNGVRQLYYKCKKYLLIRKSMMTNGVIVLIEYNLLHLTT